MKYARSIFLMSWFLGVAMSSHAASYYVDDGNTNGNVYTTAAGNDANAGTTPALPKRTITNLLTSVSLVAGDIVYIDTGIYSNYTVTITNSGSSGNPIIFQGSTNTVAGGTVISRNDAGLDVVALRGNHLEFRNLTVANGIRGFNGSLQFPAPVGLILDQVVVRGNGVALQRGQWVIRRTLFLNNSSVRDASVSSFDFDNCTFFGNGSDAVSASQADITLNNSVYVGGDFNANIIGDYNIFWDVRLLNQGRAYLYEYNLPNSTFADPGFANAAASNFFALSVSGRYNPATGAFVTDAVHSVMIDFGNPTSTAWTNESAPNGSRLNVGTYGGNLLASRSRTNAWLSALTFNDGGAITGTTQLLVWNFGSFTNNATVRLDYSADDGITWSNITTGVAVTNRSFTWNVAGVSPTAALWRVVSEGNTNVSSQNRQRFSVNGARVPYFLNDLSTNNAYYTTAVGNDTNAGTRPSAPKFSLTNLLASAFVLGKHDIIYIDSGIYSNYTVDIRRFGANNQPLIIQGVPRQEASVFRRNANASVFQFFSSHYLLKDLTIEGAGSNGSLYDGGGNGVIALENCILRSNVVAIRRGTVTARYTIFATNTTVIASDAGSYVFDQCVFWRNGQFQSSSRPWSMSNSVYVGGTLNSLAQSSAGDYCLFFETAFDGFLALHDVQEGLLRFQNSTVLDPRFHNPAQFQFQPRSLTGRYDPVTMSFTNDTEHSPAIDFGNPASSAWTNETSPNGGRLNVGVYGGTPFASRSRTNAWLQTMAYNDGGQLSVPTDYVTWNYGNLASGTTVRIEFSFNGGASWNVIATNISASLGTYLVTATNFASSRFTRWRVVLEQSPAVTSTNTVNFTYRNGPYRYYVNDASGAGDVYCTAPGSDSNIGTTPDAPKGTITGVFTNYTLEAGDIVYVDTGVYQSSLTITVPILVSGTNGNPVQIQGSTNWVAGGSVIRGPPPGSANTPGFTFASGANHIRLKDLAIQRKTIGVSLSNNTGIELENLRIESNSLSGVSGSGIAGLRITRCAIRTNAQDGVSVSSTGDVSIAHSVFWMNGMSAIRTLGPRVALTNSVLAARGAWKTLYNAPTITNIVANYNVLRVEQNASVASVATIDRQLNTLSAWQADSGMDRMSLDLDPQFVNADAGEFHLRTQTIQGRFDPLLGWVTDTTTSPLIDAGDPASPFANETAPNGGRVNIGLYGNTPEASRADFARIYSGNLNQGGFVRGTSTLHWVSAGLASSDLVQVDVSFNGGESWMSLSTGVLASTEALSWDTTTNNAAVAGLWRVRSVSNPSISAQTTNFFGIRNGTLTFYVNDSSTLGNQFTTASGSATNWVATTNRPLNSLGLVFDRYDLEPGDRVFVDRGTYGLSSPVAIGQRNSGAPTSGVISIIGATSCPTGATPVTELVGFGLMSETGVVMDQTRNMAVSNLVIRQSGTALSVLNGQSLQFEGLRILQSATNGAVINQSTNVEFRRSLFANNSAYGWSGITNSNVRLINSMFVSNNLGSVQVTGGSLGATNSLFIVNEPGLSIFNVFNNGLVRSDYNNLRVDTLASVARYNGRLSKYPVSWQQDTTNDLRSLSHDPGLYDLSNGDYHLVSQAGRYDASLCTFATDTNSSVMIDSGSPSSSVGLEPAPNGSRVNIGLYGGSTEASLSGTNSRLLTLSLNSGGTIRGTNTLYWLATGPVTGQLVYIDVSLNGGVTWTNIATNLNASSGTFVWDASQLLSTALGRWRIGSQGDGSLVVTNEVNFTLNNGSISYFVNDASTNGDVYATAPGLPENDGLSPVTPASSLASIFSRYVPGPGDVVYIDTGDYTYQGTVSLDANNSGQITNPVSVRGSTNWVAGGSRINMNGQGPLFQLSSTVGFNFQDLVLTNSRSAFVLQLSSNILFQRITIKGVTNLIALASTSGFRLESSDLITLDQVVVAEVTNLVDSAAVLLRSFGSFPAGRVSVRSSVLWSNAFGLRAQVPAGITLSNSVIVSGGSNSVGIAMIDTSQYQADYNVLRTERRGRIAQVSRITSTNGFPALTMPVYFSTMQAWRNFSARDTNSLSYEPGFANPSALDFGLLSKAGRWNISGLVTDAVSSVLIDAGNPGWIATNEPAPNGNRLNIGPDGNTTRASLSSSNAVVLLLSLYDGGYAQGTNFPLRWDLVGNFTGKTFLVQVSTNTGLSWLSVTSGVSALQKQVSWNTTNWPSGFNWLWRLVCLEDPTITAQSERTFAIRNSGFSFFVNDFTDTGDLYTTSIGSSLNSGFAPDRPKSSIQEIFDEYELEGGDTIYVDTGSYSTLGNINISRRNDTQLPGLIRIQGSTNEAAGGSVLQNGGFVLRDTRDTLIRNFYVRGNAAAGLNINASTNIQAEWMGVAGAGHGMFLQSAVDVSVRNSYITGSKTNGIQLFNINRRISFDNGIVWTNTGTAVQPVNSISISNSVLAASGAGRFIYEGFSNQTFNLNYNVYFTTNGARIARMASGLEPFPREFATLAAWRNLFIAADPGSFAGDPRLANPAALDFHPRSTGGRWSVTDSNFVVDADTSMLVDSGDPARSFTNELDPNGARMNIGRYGDTPFASKSPSTPDLLLVSLNDGGSVSGTNVLLSWVARGPATGHTAKVEVSVDGGASWVVLASNVPPATSTLSWNTTGLNSTVVGLWRVSSEVQTSLVTTAAQYFAVRNGPVTFYVNDNTTFGDRYTTTTGLFSALGVTPSTPMNSIEALLERYDLEPGDLLYVDTGTYSNGTTIVIDQLDSGFRLVGSTNSSAGGTRLNFYNTQVGMRILQAPDTQVENLGFGPVSIAIDVTESPSVVLSGLDIEGAGNAVFLFESDNVTIRNSSIRNGTDGIYASACSALALNHLVIWSNQQSAVRMLLSSGSMQNSVMGLFGGTECIGVDLDVASTWSSDYNMFNRTGQAVIARRLVSGSAYDLRWQFVSTWSRETNNDRFSLAGDPRFASREFSDFHPRSAAGRYDVVTASFVNDLETSPLIDAGSPQSAYANETGSNGGRVNIGMYGNTYEASRSPTNARLVAVRFGDGGRAEGSQVPLTWVAAGAATGHTVRLEVSMNNGGSWSVIQSNVPAEAETLFWDSGTNASWFGRWRVVSEQQPSAASTNATAFAVRNSGLALYVNDASSAGDVYTTAIGDEANNGTTPALPRLTLQSLLDDYDLEPGDSIYMDTGEFVANSAIAIGRFDGWNAMNNINPLLAGGTSLRIMGSTNDFVGGTRLLRAGTGNGIELKQALGVHLSYLSFQHVVLGGGIAVDLFDSPYVLLDYCRLTGSTKAVNLFRSDRTRMEHVLARNNTQHGILVRDSEDVALEHSVLWSNTVGLTVENLGSVHAYNNVVGSLGTNSVGWQRNDGPTPIAIGELTANYNLLWSTNGAFIAELLGNQYPAGRRRFDRMVNWSEASGLDLQSFKSDPLFANAAGGDFHPRSKYGRYLAGSGYITNVSEGFSPVIDTGDPTSSFAMETSPNGQRVDIGLYGHSSQSSLSPTNGSLQVLTFRDGGAASGEITLRWAASGPAASQLVTLQFSNDGGATWTNIASNVVASTQSYNWNSEPYGRAAAGLWRIYSQTDTNLVSQPDRFFALRQGGSIPYYINDALTAEDVYSTAPGNDANTGYLPSTPKATLQALLNDIDLEPGDVVYMDSGTYSVNLDVLWGELDGGTVTNPVVLRGSTNVLAGGTIMNRITGLGSALLISSVDGVLVQDMTFINGAYGVSTELSQNIVLRRVTVQNNNRSGIRVAGSSPTTIDNCLILNNVTNGVQVSQLSVLGIGLPGSAILRNSTIWGSTIGVSIDDGGSADVRNNLIRVNGPDSRIYYLSISQTNIQSDYNAYYRQNGAIMAERAVNFGGNEFMARLLDWQRDQGNDLRSLSHDPLVADADNADFHPISASGRNLLGGGVTNDPPGQYSPLIDTGDPALTWTNEPAPNGSRSNIGRYGNDREASRSQTNGWLLALTLNDGGRISGTNTIRWAAGGWATSDTVRIEYAVNGVDFFVIASNVPAYTAEYTWDVSNEPITQFARWKVVSEANPGTFSAVQSPFVIKNQALKVYVNDASTFGDVYSLAEGSPTNSGLLPSSPIEDPGVALERYPFSEGDVLYIDTGTFVSTNASGLRLGLVGDNLKAGLPGNPIRILGSTNLAAGGSFITSYNSFDHGIRIQKTANVSVEFLRFAGFSNGVSLVDSESVDLRQVNSHDNVVGFSSDNVISSRFERCVGWRNSRYGLLVQGPYASANWDKGVLWSNGISGVRHVFGPLSLSNSIVVASSNGVIYEINSGFARNHGDFNIYWPGGNKVLMRDELGGITYDNIRSWQRARGMDTNSFVENPFLADPEFGDFHVRSTEGRYDPFFAGFVQDTNSSWAIDAGAIDESFGLEPAPNGQRLNIGLYGNTEQASKSPTNRELFVVSLRDGGTAGSPQPLIWLTRGMTTGNTVRIEFTPNDGLDWFVLATNVPALSRSYLWDNALLDSTPLGRWRITLEQDSNVQDVNDHVFKVRNGSILYYVNDTNLVGDIYTAAIGSDLNNGITASTPVHSVEAIISRFELEGGDVIYVDTGYYPITNNIVIRTDDSGSDTNRVVIRGSTNELAGGTRMYRLLDQPWSDDDGNTNAVFELIRVRNLEIRDLYLENGNIGVLINNPLPQFDRLLLRNLEIRDGGFFGIKTLGSFDNVVEQVAVHRMAGYGVFGSGSSMAILNSVIWSNIHGSVNWSGGSLSISNTVLHAYGNTVTSSVMYISKALFNGDYNNYFNENGSSYVSLDGEVITGLPQWSQLTTQEFHSISVDPLFPNTANDQFYPRSAAGRFNPVTQTFETNDVDYSFLIDTGDPGLLAYTNEPAPNGGRINIGRHGGTARASKSRGDPWILAITAMAGGRTGGFFPLHWTYGNLSATNRVHLDYSVDGGTNWYSIASNVLITVDGYLWNSLDAQPFFQSPTTKWRVTLAADTNITDATDRTFGLNGPFRFFMNDTGTVADVFTTTAGDDENLGISSNSPKATLRAILDTWDLDPADWIYVDTGHYIITSNDIAVLRINNRGDEVNPVVVLGSTNGAVFDGNLVAPSVDASAALLFIEAPYTELDNISLLRGAIEASGTNIVLRNMRVDFGSISLLGQYGILESFYLTNGSVVASGPDMQVSSGYVLDGSMELTGARAALRNTVIAGSVSPLIKINGTNVSVINNTLVAGQTAVVQEGADSRSVLRNNILVANGAPGTAFAIERKGGVVESDYNLFWIRNGAWFGNSIDGLWERLIYWQEKSGGDLNSIAADPLFANETLGDFHVKSVVGRYQNGVWVTDVVHSAAIDAGSLSDSFAGEPAPNGNRINIGAYGNTEQASLSRVVPWLYVQTMNDGGVIRGTNTLRWLSGSVDATNTVTLQYSANGGANWITIVSGVPANSGSYLWNTTTASNTLDALWRVVLDGNTNILDVSDSIFNIRNDLRAFYVNNGSTIGDVYTTAVGSPLNDGRTPATPKATLEDLLATYDTEPFDTIYVDTGIYTSSVINVIWSRSGSTNGFMTIQGSTNVAAGGTVIRRPAFAGGEVIIVYASHIIVRNLTLENASRGIFLSDNKDVRVEQIAARSNTVGVLVRGGENHRITSSRIWNNALGGVEVSDSVGVNIENITFVNNLPYNISFDSNVFNSVIQNNIFYQDVATSNQQFAMVGPTGNVLSAFIDYNVYFFGPASASNTFIYAGFKDLLPWQRLQNKDFRSAVTNPAFANFAAEDFHLRSQQGRYNPAINAFVLDTNTSWAIDKGNPSSDFSREPEVNGGRVNVGAYGNTPYASKGTTNETVYTRTADNFLPLTEAENPYPLVWYVLNIPDDITVSVQYSGDGGTEWITLESGVPAYQEYIVWTNSPTYNSFNARWRIVGEGPGNTNYWDINNGQIKTFFGNHRISSVAAQTNKAVTIVWRGAWDENYQVQYATNMLGTNRIHNWINAGPVTNLTIGGDIPFTDPASTGNTFRVYRVIWFGTNGIPYQ